MFVVDFEEDCLISLSLPIRSAMSFTASIAERNSFFVFYTLVSLLGEIAFEGFEVIDKGLSPDVCYAAAGACPLAYEAFFCFDVAGCCELVYLYA